MNALQNALKNRFTIHSNVTAMQVITVNTEIETIEYGAIDEVLENNYVHLYDSKTGKTYELEHTGYDGDVYEEIKEKVQEILTEEKSNES